MQKINLYLSRRIESYNSEGDSLTLEFRCAICNNPKVKNAAKQEFRHFEIKVTNGDMVRITPVPSSVGRKYPQVPKISGKEAHILNEFAKLYYIAYNKHEEIVLTVAGNKISVG